MNNKPWEELNGAFSFNCCLPYSEANGNNRSRKVIFKHFSDVNIRSGDINSKHAQFEIQSGPKKCIHSLLINIFGINLNEISISG